jgi:Tfp pilus assembly protein PilV|tara:strand:- start:1647 stop:2228 length:582 start_codon:yes stop_codon:yes gene_type:complete
MVVFGLEIRRIKEKGVTILEGLVATAIVGIGFVAIFQMVTYSVQSMDVSSQRTKSSYLMHMVAEDVIGHKNSEKGSTKLKDLLVTNRDDTTLTTWNMPACLDEGIDTDDYTNAYDNIIEKKWQDNFSKKRLKCKNANESKHFKVIEICRTGCVYINSQNSFFATNGTERTYFGKVQSNINNGRKQNYLYFRID